MDQKLTEKHKIGAELFAIERCEMDCKDDNGKNMRDFRPIFYCKDVIGLLKLLYFFYTSLKNPFDTNDLLYSPCFCGVGTARSTYPCHICIMPAKDFGKIEDEMMLKGGELRTLKSIHENAMKYQAEAKKHKGKTKLSSAPLNITIVKTFYVKTSGVSL